MYVVICFIDEDVKAVYGPYDARDEAEREARRRRREFTDVEVHSCIATDWSVA